MTIREGLPGQDGYPHNAAPAPASAPSGLPSVSPSKPYWLVDPSSVLFGLRSTPGLPATADVVIVGSGITGAFAADALVSDDLSVVMLEAREACFGATGRNGGHCQPGVYAAPPDIAGFELATFRFLRDLVAHHKIPCDWRTLPHGGVHAYMNEDLFAQAQRLVAALKQIDPGLAELVEVVKGEDSESLRLMNAAGAVVQTHAASVWPYKLIAWLLEQLVQKHSAKEFNLQTNTPVQSLEKDTATTSDYPWKVVTSRGVITAKSVLLATNGYTSHLLPAMADLIVPVRGQVAALAPPVAPTDESSSADSLRIPSSYVFLGIDPNFDSIDSDEYLVQRPFVSTASSSSPGGHLILGGGRQRAAVHGINEWRDDTIEPTVAAYLRERLVPVLDVGQGKNSAEKELKADYEWTGVMGFSRDDHPWVGQVPPSLVPGTADTCGLYICAGYTGHGMPNAALSGLAVAHMIRNDLSLPAGLPAHSVSAFVSSSPESATIAATAVSRLPKSYIITPERVDKARADNAEVGVADGTVEEFRQAVAEMEALARAKQ